jgi:hypothetical protein
MYSQLALLDGTGFKELSALLFGPLAGITDPLIAIPAA